MQKSPITLSNKSIVDKPKTQRVSNNSSSLLTPINRGSFTKTATPVFSVDVTRTPVVKAGAKIYKRVPSASSLTLKAQVAAAYTNSSATSKNGSSATRMYNTAKENAINNSSTQNKWSIKSPRDSK
jgi:hypothetical protein